MVDFQSRDTRRGPTTDDTDEESAESDGDASDSGDTDTTDSGEGDVTAGGDEGTPTDAKAVEETATAETQTDVTEVEESSAETATDVTEVEESSVETATEVAGGEAAVVDETETQEAPSESPDTGGQPIASKAVPQASPGVNNRTVDVAVVTVGTERFEPLEDAVTTVFESAGHRVVTRERLRGGYDAVQQMVESLVGRKDVDVVVTVGGVGIAPEDLAIEAVHPLLEKALPGFGETLRSLLFEHVGTGIVGVRSAAGVAEGTLVFCLPGDVDAASLAAEEILAVEAPDLVSQLG